MILIRTFFCIENIDKKSAFQSTNISKTALNESTYNCNFYLKKYEKHN